VLILGIKGHLAELTGGFLEFLVLDQLVDELPARIELVLLGIGVDRLLVLGEEQAAFDLHQRRRHDEELAGHLDLELLHRIDGVQILLRHRGNGNVVDIELVLPEEEQEQVQRPLKDGQFDAIIGFGNHGASRGTGGTACNRKNRLRKGPKPENRSRGQTARRNTAT
jgi:hypothetical protein